MKEKTSETMTNVVGWTVLIAIFFSIVVLIRNGCTEMQENYDQHVVKTCAAPNEFDKCWCYYDHPEIAPEVSRDECEEFYIQLQRQKARER